MEAIVLQPQLMEQVVLIASQESRKPDELDEIGAPLVDSKRIRSHWGEWRQVLVFAVDVAIDDLRLPAIEVVGDEVGSEIILGRNALNRLSLLINGPRQEIRVAS
jgi:hypothetical protein